MPDPAARRSPKQQAGLRFATITAVIGAVGANGNVVDSTAGVGDKRAQLVVHFRQCVRIEKPSGKTGLIAGDGDGKTRS